MERYCLQVPWGHDPAFAKAWEEGKTGYPYIDALMRQLRETGWIHHLGPRAKLATPPSEILGERESPLPPVRPLSYPRKMSSFISQQNQKSTSIFILQIS